MNNSFILIDAGATKTDFTMLTEGKVINRHSGEGINPNYCTEEEIMRVFADFVQQAPGTSGVSKIFYYGAGCASAQNACMMQGLIANFFPTAEIEVFSDLVAVCHALSRDAVAIIAILGTGSSTCLFDGTKIVHRAPSLGYMLGDEGSGTNLGKRLLAAYLNGQLSDTLRDEFEKTYDITFEKAIRRIYKEPEPNKFMSMLAPFVQKHIDHPFIYKLAYDAFSAFFETQKVHYPAEANLHWHLSGSVAYYFREVIQKAAEAQGCKLGMIVSGPMERLTDYYKDLK